MECEHVEQAMSARCEHAEMLRAAREEIELLNRRIEMLVRELANAQRRPGSDWELRERGIGDY